MIYKMHNRIEDETYHLYIDDNTKKPYVFSANVLNIWSIYDDTVPISFGLGNVKATDVTKDFIKYDTLDKNDDNSIWIHCRDFFEKIDIKEMQDDEDDGDWSVGSESSETVQAFHEDAKLFDEWEPQTNEQKRYKEMVNNLERKYKKAKHNQ